MVAMASPSSALDRIARIQTVMRDLSREHDPDATLERFAAAMDELYGQQAAIFVRVVDDVPGGYVVKRLVDEHGESVERRFRALRRSEGAPTGAGRAAGRGGSRPASRGR